MREITSEKRWLRILAFFSSIFLQLFITAYSDDSSTSKNGAKTEDHAPSGGSKGTTIAVIFLVLLGVALLSFFLYKFWQKKRREEQYARLLKLFEEDDELELELGLRD